MKKKIYRLTPDEKQKVMKALALQLGEKEKILFAYAFGSFGEDMPFHDVDVGIYLSVIEQKSASQYGLELAGELERRLSLPVDVRVLNFAPVSFLYHVLRGKIIFERDEDLRSEIVEQTVRRYLDIKPIIKKEIQEAFAA